MKIRITGMGFADEDGDQIGLKIRCTHGPHETEFSMWLDADKSEVLQEAFVSAIAAAMQDVDNDESEKIQPVVVEC